MEQGGMNANVRRRTSGGASLIPAQQHNRAGHSGEKLVGGRIEAEMAKADLQAFSKNIIWRTVPEQSK
jgi:hypothetical protein